jgi:hypothetical protein
MYMICIQSCRLTDEQNARLKLSINVLTKIPRTSSRKFVAAMNLEMARE